MKYEIENPPQWQDGTPKLSDPYQVRKWDYYKQTQSTPLFANNTVIEPFQQNGVDYFFSFHANTIELI
jgi:outer membrane protein assembly factor BamE (lipoprotein component of BamABCDE complex)